MADLFEWYAKYAQYITFGDCICIAACFVNTVFWLLNVCLGLGWGSICERVHLLW